jgi:hypothetical protein
MREFLHPTPTSKSNPKTNAITQVPHSPTTTTTTTTTTTSKGRFATVKTAMMR